NRSVAFFAGTNLKRIDIDGGLPQTLARIDTARGGAWGPDGTILFGASYAGPLFRIPASGGQPVAVTKLNARQRDHSHPIFLPGGRQFLFDASGAEDVQGTYIGTSGSWETKRLMADTGVAYVSPGWLLFVRQ